VRFQHKVNDIDPTVSVHFICTWAKDISYDDKSHISHIIFLNKILINFSKIIDGACKEENLSEDY